MKGLRQSLVLLGPGRPKLGLEFCKGIAESRGGRLLSAEYRRNSGLLSWECGKGHQCQAAMHNIKDKGSWCPFCAGNHRLDLAAAMVVAKSRGGKCLSNCYKNSSTPSSLAMRTTSHLVGKSQQCQEWGDLVPDLCWEAPVNAGSSQRGCCESRGRALVTKLR